MIRPINVTREVYVDGTQRKIRQVANDKVTGEYLGECMAEYVSVPKFYSTKNFLGSYAITKTPFHAQAKPHMSITSIEVAQQARRQNVATQLVAGIVKESKASGFDGRVVLHAENFKESPLPAYIKMGFTTANPTLDMRVRRFLEFPLGKFNPFISSFMMLPKKAIARLIKMA